MTNFAGAEMLFEPLPIEGAVLVQIEANRDGRGFFARTFCTREFTANGLPSSVVQASISYNELRGTVRGMHFQWPHSREDKLVRCVRGSLLDVLLDLRPNSSSYLQHCSVRLDDENRNSVFIPHGIAHGFQTLADHTEVLYQMTDFFAPELGSGVRWNDPEFGIRWPLPPSKTSDRDASYPDFNREQYEAEFAERQRAPEPA
jgi:dTDP-4-dehydrorhamnose 3,5-epimerase